MAARAELLKASVLYGSASLFLLLTRSRTKNFWRLLRRSRRNRTTAYGANPHLPQYDCCTFLMSASLCAARLYQFAALFSQ
jgi:hypothetical protein